MIKAPVNDRTKIQLLEEFDTVLSLDLIESAKKRRITQRQPSEETQKGDSEILALIEARTQAKKAKNFSEADRIRDELKARGIVLTDTPQGVQWRRV